MNRVSHDQPGSRINLRDYAGNPVMGVFVDPGVDFRCRVFGIADEIQVGSAGLVEGLAHRAKIGVDWKVLLYPERIGNLRLRRGIRLCEGQHQAVIGAIDVVVAKRSEPERFRHLCFCTAGRAVVGHCERHRDAKRRYDGILLLIFGK